MAQYHRPRTPLDPPTATAGSAESTAGWAWRRGKGAFGGSGHGGRVEVVGVDGGEPDAGAAG